MLRRLASELGLIYDALICRLLFKISTVDFHSDFVSKGLPQVRVAKSGKLTIGKQFRMNNGHKYNLIGRQQACQFVVGPGAQITIGDNVGMSSSTLVSRENITIGNRVKLGGNVVIYDSDFHSLDSELRADRSQDELHAKNNAVLIGDDAFIGAHTTILKGVSIGKGAIVGACSVVTKSIPDNEIWAGNPAKFIRKITGSAMSKVA